MKSLLPMPLTVRARGARVLIVQATIPQGPPLLEVLPYDPLRDTARLGALVAARLNFYPRLLEVLRLTVDAYDGAPEVLTPQQRFAAVAAADLLNKIGGHS